MTTAQTSLVHRAAVLAVEIERLEQQFSKSVALPDGALSDYAGSVGQLHDLLQTLGMHRSQPSIGKAA